MKYIVECKPDKLLIKFLTNAPKKSIIHAANKTEVLKTLLKATDDAIGIIDEDDPYGPQPSHLQKFKIKNDLPSFGLSILQENQTEKKLIKIKPRLEDWLLEAANESGVSFEEYRLPKNAKKLHKIINLNLDKLELILKKLVEAKNNRLRKLKEILKSFGAI